MLNKIYVAVLHYPITGKDGRIVTTAVVNMDVHDIARTCRTYMIKRYYVVNNLPVQKQIVARVLNFWGSDFGKNYNASRYEALKLVKMVSYYEDLIEDITKAEGISPIKVFTSAKKRSNMVSYDEMKEMILGEERPILFLFGTGQGMPKEILETCDVSLESIRGHSDYNHLSVRSAVAITLDRVIGEFVQKGGS
ncbi:MAG: RNA methyltransferase [Thermotogae bacterium]|jgi:hypothetical protein|nr:RNA methyltransferase [Thermotogota bacterium]MCL5033186.1 RNA methyltransferase [Thermotogota bacterium]